MQSSNTPLNYNSGLRPHGRSNSRQKRSRTSLACTRCRRRKTRCDSQHPACSECVRRRLPEQCIYQRFSFRPSNPPSHPQLSFPVADSNYIPPNAGLQSDNTHSEQKSPLPEHQNDVHEALCKQSEKCKYISANNQCSTSSNSTIPQSRSCW
jgi:hypothetical protein